MDPTNKIEESNEDNNSYQIGAARFKAVQFYKIYIYNDHDKRSKGEWDIHFCAQTKHNGEFNFGECTHREYQWGGGEHTIHNLFLSPTLFDNDKLIIKAFGFEMDYDGWSSDGIGDVMVYHSPDGTIGDVLGSGFIEEGSWREGDGEFSEKSDKGDYEIFYRIILE